jgi:hypothetical protein
MADSSDIKIIILMARDSERWPFLSKPNRRETIPRSVDQKQLQRLKAASDDEEEQKSHNA